MSNIKKVINGILIGLVGSVIVLIVLLGVSHYIFSGEPYVIEAGYDFDISELTDDIPIIDFDKINISGTVDSKRPGMYSVVYSFGPIAWERKVMVVDSTAPVLFIIDETIQIKEGDIFDENQAIREVSDNTINVNISSKVIDGDITKKGQAIVEITAYDDYGNSTSDRVIVEIVEQNGPQIILNTREITIQLGETIDIESIVKETKSSKGSVTLSSEIKEGSIQTSGKAVVNIIATDIEGVVTKEALIVNVEDHIPPEIEARKDVVTFVLGKKITAGSLLTKISDNDGNPKLTTQVVSGDPTVPGNCVIEVTATDKSGNSTVANANVFIKAPVYNNLGWDITGIDKQPYLVATNRVFNTVTVYGQDQNGDYSVPVKAICCSVGREGHDTPTGRWNTSTRYRWRLMVDGTYAQYAIRINGGIMFHSVPYYSQNVADLEYPEYNKLGSPASLGCIRMTVADIMWLYNNCPNGFPAIIYDDPTSPGPLGKPATPQINEFDPLTRVWDPTDPTPGNPWTVPTVEDAPVY